MEFTLPTMTCSHCVQSVTRAIEALDAGATVHADVATHRVQVDTVAEPDAVRAALVAAGYTPD